MPPYYKKYYSVVNTTTGVEVIFVHMKAAREYIKFIADAPKEQYIIKTHNMV